MAQYSWIRSTAKDCRKRAMARWGHGWALLSEDQREAFLALEALKVLLAQSEHHASEPVRRLQEVARLAVYGVAPKISQPERSAPEKA